VSEWESGTVRIVLDGKRLCDFTYEIASGASPRLDVKLQPRVPGETASSRQVRTSILGTLIVSDKVRQAAGWRDGSAVNFLARRRPHGLTRRHPSGEGVEVHLISVRPLAQPDPDFQVGEAGRHRGQHHDARHLEHPAAHSETVRPTMGRDLPARVSTPLIKAHFKDWRHYGPIGFRRSGTCRMASVLNRCCKGGAPGVHYLHRGYITGPMRQGANSQWPRISLRVRAPEATSISRR